MLTAMLLTLSLADVLGVGKPAPPMSADSVVKGKAVTTFEPGKVYVVEFWATWCPPCVRSVPHLTALQKKHPEATVIGVAGSERPARNGGNLEDGVKEFVKKQGSKMDYTVVYDGDGTMAQTWMVPAKQRGIPCAFVVDGEGKISHIGFPDDSLDAAVEKAVKASAKAPQKPDAKKPADGSTGGGTGGSSGSGGTPGKPPANGSGSGSGGNSSGSGTTGGASGSGSAGGSGSSGSGSNG